VEKGDLTVRRELSTSDASATKLYPSESGHDRFVLSSVSPQRRSDHPFGRKILLEQNKESPVERVRDMTPETIAPSGAISPSSFTTAS
jgi:hypothetical protein